MRYRFYTCDVFTATRFGGNPLAVLTNAVGLSAGRMQQIAREFNFSETTFVLPPEQGHTRRVRIFTPTAELPFAGHPNVGTAFVLAATGELGPIGKALTVTFEEPAGAVPVSIQERVDGFWCELKAPAPLSLGPQVDRDLIAEAVGLDSSDGSLGANPPQVASVGLPFIMVELTDRAALARARYQLDAFRSLAAMGVPPAVLLFTRSGDEFDLRVRMFAPLDNGSEDPATGSANGALAAFLTHLDGSPNGQFRWRIAQGVEMGRPSLLEARTEKRDGVVTGTWIGGASVLVSDGYLEVD